MQIPYITTLSIILTFLFDVVFREGVKKHPFLVAGRKIHHSVLGIILLAAGIAINNQVLLGIGLGMYLAHGLEEMYFENTAFYKAFFVFVTRK